MFKIIWKNEVIDTAETLKEAEYLQREYQMAFRNPLVGIKFPNELTYFGPVSGRFSCETPNVQSIPRTKK